jgi:hypothetical protein
MARPNRIANPFDDGSITGQESAFIAGALIALMVALALAEYYSLWL